MSKQLLNEPGEAPFPEGFDPVAALNEYLAAHQAVRFLVTVILIGLAWLVFSARATTDVSDSSPVDPMIAMLDAAPFDDEPLDEEDLHAIDEADLGTSVSVDDYFARRSAQAS